MFIKSCITTIGLCCVLVVNGFSQHTISLDSLEHPDRFVSKYLPMLTDKELMKIASLPDFQPEQFQPTNKIALPYKVDNSIQPYMIVTTWQAGYECGQSASIADDFTYEINRLRNLPSNVPQNRYVTHFAWNFLNGGYNYTGASYYDSWEIIRTCGTPNVSDYGGDLWTGGEKRWMTGYNLYYNAMHNRLYTGYNIQVGTPEGLLILKNWIHNHLDGSVVGGLANFYAQYGSPNTTLPVGTEEAGKALMSTWGGSPSHTWTVVGYNDSIRYDFNGDGIYTNNIDINGDGVVDMHDWEIGGLKFINGYSGAGWGNGGYCYMMYKCLADNIGNGGIWNNRVSIQYVKQNYDPLLTMKIQLKHNSRNKIKVTAGLSTNLSDTKPQYVLNFPIYNFQGGDYYMQGDTTEAAKSIEFGLDITPLLSYIQPGQNAKYFLQVAENDPAGLYTGQIISYSIIDYTTGVSQTDCPSTNVVLLNNDTTRLSITSALNFSKVGITTTSLPDAAINEPYSTQLSAANGATPYHWDYLYDFTATYTTGTTPSASTQLVTNSTGYAVQNLGFDFPFYGEKFNKLYISPDGYIKFTDQVYTWPYLVDKVQLFKSTKMIAPFLTDLSFGAGNGFWYEGNSTHATFKWVAYVTGQSTSSVNFTVKLYPSGKIEMYYDNISVAPGTGWISAVTRGDNFNYQYTKYSDLLNANTSTKLVVLDPPSIPFELKISDDGILSGTPIAEYNSLPITFKVTDNNSIVNTKTLTLSTNGVLAAYKVSAGLDTIINANEHVLLSVALENIGNATIANAQMKISTTDSHVTLVDSVETVGNLLPDDSVAFLNAFSFDVDSTVEDNHIIELNLKVYNTTDTFNIRVSLPVRSLILDIGSVTIADGNNNILEPGENASIIIEIKNIGGAKAFNVNGILSTNDPYVGIISDSMHFASLIGETSANGFYVVNVSNTVPDGHIVIFNLKLTADGGYVTHKFFAIQIGGNAEDFETADLTRFPWTTSGDSVWFVTNQLPYEGLECVKSGNINDYGSTSLALNLNILNSGTMSFYRKVSCEAHVGFTDYDFLAFYIDGVEKARWDGITAWQRFDYAVSSGVHTFNWTYKKDLSVSAGEDCAWLDYIVFPPSIELSSNVTQNPNSIFKSMHIDSIAIDSIQLVNNSLGNTLLYQCEIKDFSANGNNTWLTSEVNYGSLDASAAGALKLHFDSHGLANDTYNCMIKLTYNLTDTVNIPVTFQVIVPTGMEQNNANSNNLQVYPNPFNNETTFSFALTKPTDVSLAIVDVTGKEIKSLTSSDMASGSYTFYWDGTNSSNDKIASGIYYYRFVCDDYVTFGRIVYMK
ncbi:MAG: FlgD immunoglobulin-like domain containing protein [Bacteroidota bacterium]